MKIDSEYTPKGYIHHLRCHMSAHSDFGAERFTGFFAGHFFYVTRHSRFEWNRKFTNPKNAALGYVKKTENGCQVRFIRFRGMLCPMEFLPLLLFCLSACLLVFAWDGLSQYYPFALLLAFFCIAFYAPLETLLECMTEESEQGRRILLSFLKDPADPYGNLSYIP